MSKPTSQILNEVKRYLDKNVETSSARVEVYDLLRATKESDALMTTVNYLERRYLDGDHDVWDVILAALTTGIYVGWIAADWENASHVDLWNDIEPIEDFSESEGDWHQALPSSSLKPFPSRGEHTSENC